MDPVTSQLLRRAIIEGGSGNTSVVADLEVALASLVGATYALCTSSGTAALCCALRAVGVGPGDRVGVSALGPAMTGLAILAVGGQPVFLDTASATSFGINPLAAERVASALKAVLLVPMWGYWDEQVETLALFRHYQVPIIVDAAQAPFLRLNGGLCDTVDVVCLSLHGRKPIKAGEGGACLSNQRRLAERMLAIRNFGQTAKLDNGRLVPTGPFAAHDGTNFKINALGAAWCLAQLSDLSRLRARLERLRDVAVATLEATAIGWSEATQAADVAEHGRYGIVAVCAHTADARGLAAALARSGIEVDTSRYAYAPMYSQGILCQYTVSCPAAEQLTATAVACRLEAFTGRETNTSESPGNG